MADDPRTVLEALIRERGEDFSSLSRMLGRNPAYIQQYIKRGVPRKLDEEDRRILAEYLGVDDRLLGAPARAAPSVAAAEAGLGRGHADFVAVPRLDLRAAAGAGAFPGEENSYDRLRFDHRFLREVAGGGTAGLSTIRVSGDSMVPTLADGDEILVNRADAAERLRDGIYVLRVDDALIVKRLAVNPAGGRITVRSDNSNYPPWPECDRGEVTVIGRVVWTGRRIG